MSGLPEKVGVAGTVKNSRKVGFFGKLKKPSCLVRNALKLVGRVESRRLRLKADSLSTSKPNLAKGMVEVLRSQKPTVLIKVRQSLSFDRLVKPESSLVREIIYNSMRDIWGEVIDR